MRASHKTNLPSASVFKISTVFPDIVVTISPGLVALLPGMFSAAATNPTTLIGNLSSAIQPIVAITLAAPHMSNFISSIPPLDFKLIPPVSNVIPFPTIACGLVLAFAPLYSITISLASSADPADTESREPIPNLAICFSLRILAETLRFLFAREVACSAR